MFLLRRVTFEVRRDQRPDARPGLVKMYAYHQPGPGGLPLGLASTEGLGRTLRRLKSRWLLRYALKLGV